MRRLVRSGPAAALAACMAVLAAPDARGAGCTPTPTANCAQNGDFEAGNLSSWTCATFCPGGSCFVTPGCFPVTPWPENGFQPPSPSPTEVGSCNAINYVACGSFAAQVFSGDGNSTTGSWARLERSFATGCGIDLSFQYAATFQSYVSPPDPPPSGSLVVIEVIVTGGSCGTQTIWSASIQAGGGGTLLVSPSCDPWANPCPWYLDWTGASVSVCGYPNCTATLRMTAYSGISQTGTNCQGNPSAGGMPCGFGYLDQVICRPCCSPTPTASGSATATRTRSPTPSASATVSGTHTVSPTPSESGTPTGTATITRTATITLTHTITATATITDTPTRTYTPHPPVLIIDRNVIRGGDRVTVTWLFTTEGPLSLRVFNSAGEFIQTIWEGSVATETWYQASWNLDNFRSEPVSSNVYILHIVGPRYSRTTKLAVLRDD